MAKRKSTTVKRVVGEHARCKHPWYVDVPYCATCWTQHNGAGCRPMLAAAEPAWAYSGDGLGTWWKMTDVASSVGDAIAALGKAEPEEAESEDSNDADDYDTEVG